MLKNVAGQFIGAQMLSATDGGPFTGTVSVAVTVNGGTQSAGGGTVTHEGGGYHSYAPTQAETNGDHVAYTFSGTGALSVTAQTYPRTTPVTISDIASPGDVAAEVLSAATAAPIAADVKKVNAVTIDGDGALTPWGPA